MVRFLGVASLLFFSFVAVVAADNVPRMPTSDATGRFRRGCSGESYDDIQLEQLAYSLSAQISALMGRAAQKITFVAQRVDVRA